MTYNKWEIWEAEVSFEDKAKSKKRPVVILEDNLVAVLAVKMTSHEPRYKTLEGEYELSCWQEAGLLKPTVAQCSKILTLDKSKLTEKKYGTLTARDIIGLQAILRYMGYSK